MRGIHTSAEDWRAAADFLAEAALVESTHELDEFAPPQLRRLFSADLVVWERFSNDFTHLAFRLDPVPAGPLGVLHEAFVHHFPEHPAHPRFREGFARGMVFVMSDFTSTRNFLQTGLWREAYIHLRAKHQLGLSGRIGDDALQGIAINRLSRDFGPRDRELAKFIHPRLLKIVRVKTRQARVVHTADAFKGFFQQLHAAFALAGPDGRIIEISAAGQALLARMIPGGLPAPNLLPEPCARLCAELRRGAVSSQRKLFASVPLTASLQALVMWLAADRSALVIFQEMPAQGGISLPCLTRREAEILGWLSEGKSNAAIGLLLGISPRTVEKHCGSLFAKLGVETRFAAALFARQQAGS